MGYHDPHYEYDDKGRKTALTQEGRDFYAEGDRIGATAERGHVSGVGYSPLYEIVFPILQEVLNKKTFLLWLIIGAVLFPTGLAAHLGDKLGLVIAAIVFMLSPRFRAIALFVGGILAAIVGAFWLFLYFLGEGIPRVLRPSIAERKSPPPYTHARQRHSAIGWNSGA